MHMEDSTSRFPRSWYRRLIGLMWFSKTRFCIWFVYFKFPSLLILSPAPQPWIITPDKYNCLKVKLTSITLSFFCNLQSYLRGKWKPWTLFFARWLLSSKVTNAMQLHPHFPSKEIKQENLARVPPSLKFISHDLHMCPRAFLSSAGRKCTDVKGRGNAYDNRDFNNSQTAL